jgi:hypothetical protein
MTAGPGDDWDPEVDGERAHWDRVERRDEIMNPEGPPDPGDPYDHADDDDIEPDDA